MALLGIRAAQPVLRGARGRRGAASAEPWAPATQRAHDYAKRRTVASCTTVAAMARPRGANLRERRLADGSTAFWAQLAVAEWDRCAVTFGDSREGITRGEALKELERGRSRSRPNSSTCSPNTSTPASTPHQTTGYSQQAAAIPTASETRSATSPAQLAVQGSTKPASAYELHDLRHAFASHLILDVGLDVAEVSRILGHANPSTTLDIYTHLFDHARHNADLRRQMATSAFLALLEPPTTTRQAGNVIPFPARTPRRQTAPNADLPINHHATPHHPAAR